MRFTMGKFRDGNRTLLPVSAGKPKRGPDAEKAVPDLLVYVEDSNLVTPSVLLQAEAVATRMFAGIGLRVEWTERRTGRGAEPVGTTCAPKRPAEIGVRMAQKRTSSASPEAFASAHPFSNDGVRITVFYGELHEAIRHQSRLEPVVLAHVLVHELTHVLQGVTLHSDSAMKIERASPISVSVILPACGLRPLLPAARFAVRRIRLPGGPWCCAAGAWRRSARR